MLATGESMELAWKAFLTKGKPAKLQMACVIASQQGVKHMAELFPGDDVTLWCAAIDLSWTSTNTLFRDWGMPVISIRRETLGLKL